MTFLCTGFVRFGFAANYPAGSFLPFNKGLLIHSAANRSLDALFLALSVALFLALILVFFSQYARAMTFLCTGFVRFGFAANYPAGSFLPFNEGLLIHRAANRSLDALFLALSVALFL